MVMGRDSHSECRGFESRHRILDGHFFTYYCCKNCNVCLKRPKINEKEAGIGPLFLKKNKQESCFYKIRLVLFIYSYRKLLCLLLLKILTLESNELLANLEGKGLVFYFFAVNFKFVNRVKKGFKFKPTCC